MFVCPSFQSFSGLPACDNCSDKKTSTLDVKTSLRVMPHVFCSHYAYVFLKKSLQGVEIYTNIRGKNKIYGKKYIFIEEFQNFK